MSRSLSLVLMLHAGCSSRPLPLETTERSDGGARDLAVVGGARDLAIEAAGDLAVAEARDLGRIADMTARDLAPAVDAAPARSWQPAVELGAGDFIFGYFPSVAINNLGEAVVAWRGDGSPGHNIWASRFLLASLTWEDAAAVPFSTGFVNGVSVGIDDTGQAAAALGLAPPELAHYDATTGMWIDQTLTSPTSNSDWGFYPALPTATRIMGLWSENPNLGGNQGALWTGRYDLFGWSNIQELDTNNDQGIDGARLKATANGHGAAVWGAWFGNGRQIWASQLDAASQTWSPGVRIDPGQFNMPYTPDIAVDDDGNAIATWLGNEIQGAPIMVRRYDATSQTWQAAQDLGASGETPRVCMSANGEALVVWKPWSTSSDGRLSFSHYANGTWSPAQQISVGPAGWTPDLDVAMNNSGEAVLVWNIEVVGSYSKIYAARFE